MGHFISETGVSPSPDTVKEISAAQPPKNIKELQSFLKLMSYVRKFIPNLSAKLAPLLSLLRQGVKYSWGTAQNKAFCDAKAAITSSNFLVHFDSKKSLFIYTDASDNGIAAVLCHEFKVASNQFF